MPYSTVIDYCTLSVYVTLSPYPCRHSDSLECKYSCSLWAHNVYFYLYFFLNFGNRKKIAQAWNACKTPVQMLNKSPIKWAKIQEWMGPRSRHSGETVALLFTPSQLLHKMLSREVKGYADELGQHRQQLCHARRLCWRMASYEQNGF